jgi:hypothetical protein
MATATNIDFTSIHGYTPTVIGHKKTKKQLKQRAAAKLAMIKHYHEAILRELAEAQGSADAISTSKKTTTKPSTPLTAKKLQWADKEEIRQ